MAATTAKGRPLGRNAYRYWLYVLCHSSGRKSQPYRLNKKELSEIGLSKSSAYEAISDLIHCGFIQGDKYGQTFSDGTILNPHQYKIIIPKKSEISDSDKTKQSENRCLFIMYRYLLTLLAFASTSLWGPASPRGPAMKKNNIKIHIFAALTQKCWESNPLTFCQKNL